MSDALGIAVVFGGAVFFGSGVVVCWGMLHGRPVSTRAVATCGVSGLVLGVGCLIAGLLLVARGTP